MPHAHLLRAACSNSTAPYNLTLCLLPRICPQVFYNNLLSLPFIAAMMLVTGEVHKVWSEPDLTNPTFLAVAAVSGLIGFGIRWEAAAVAGPQQGGALAASVVGGRQCSAGSAWASLRLACGASFLAKVHRVATASTNVQPSCPGQPIAAWSAHAAAPS